MHYSYIQAHTTAFREDDIVNELSHTLREVIIFETRHELIDTLKFFNHKSMSDQFISETLGQENIDIARRTVAKYRELLGILPSSKRKRFVAET